MTVQDESVGAAGGGAQHSHVNLGNSARVTLMLTPDSRGTFREQGREVLSAMAAVLDPSVIVMSPSTATPGPLDAIRERLAERLLPTAPHTTFSIPSSGLSCPSAH